MYDFRAWLRIGIIVVPILTVFALWARTTPIETDLVSRSTKALGEGGAWATLSANGRDMHLGGTADSEASAANAVLSVENTHGVRVVKADTDLPALREPFTFGASLADDRVSLSGYVATEAERESVLWQFGTDGREVDDQLQIARGSSDDHRAAVALGAELFSKLSDGKLDVVDQVLNISGHGADGESYNAVTSMLDQANSAVSLGSVDLSPPIIDGFSTTLSWQPKLVSLRGAIASDASKQALQDAIKAQLPDAQIDDALVLGANGPADQDANLMAFVKTLPEFERGEFTLSEAGYSLHAVAASSDSYSALTRSKSIEGLNVASTAFDIQAPSVASYFFAAIDVGGKAKLLGFVPSQAELKALSAEADTSELRIAQPAPEDFAKRASLLAQSVLKVDEGYFEWSGDRLLLKGLAADQASHDALLASLAAFEGQGIDDQIRIRSVASPSVPAAPAKAEVVPAAPEVATQSREACAAILKKGLAKPVNFTSKKAELTADSKAMLNKLGAELSGCGGVKIVVEGHTDATGGLAKNQKLSEQRAQSAADAIAAGSADRLDISAVGYGESRPIKSNKNRAGRLANRRIEVKLAP